MNARRSSSSNNALQREARNTPGTPPPVTVTELASAETRLGFALPELLRRIYLEVANGVVLDLFALPSAASMHDERRSLLDSREKLVGGPKSETSLRHAVPIVDYGCGQWLWVDTSGALYLLAEGGVYRSPPTFAEWLTASIAGDSHSLLFAAGEPRYGINPFPVRLVFVDSDPDVAEALARAFASFAEVSVHYGDLLATAEHAIVSPANSQGFMDGGFDRALVTHFGASLERRVRDAIAARPEGYLPIGASFVIETGHARVPYLIVAPTMLSPELVEAQNAYRAMRAILRVAAQLPEEHRTIYCPGLCTGVGGVEPASAAAEMANAYSDWCASPR